MIRTIDDAFEYDSGCWFESKEYAIESFNNRLKKVGLKMKPEEVENGFIGLVGSRVISVIGVDDIVVGYAKFEWCFHPHGCYKFKGVFLR